MKTSFTTLACPDWELDEILTRAAEYGYDAVDFRGLGGKMGVFIRPEFTDDAPATRARLAELGLVISCFSSGARLCSPDARTAAKMLSEVKEYATLCGRFDVPCIRVFGGQCQDERPIAARKAAGVMDEMAAIAAPATICLETHDDWTRAEDVAALMEATKAENVGVCWDLHHPYRMAGEDPQTTWDTLGRWICYTHVKDSAPKDDGFAYCLPGEGDVPLEAMIRLLGRNGYDGYLTVEWEKRWHPEIADPAVALPAYSRFLSELS
ncbi:MAG: sugar phosphate isomerase/epimerase family protein [Phycisphaerae bacterium]